MLRKKNTHSIPFKVDTLRTAPTVLPTERSNLEGDEIKTEVRQGQTPCVRFREVSVERELTLKENKN